MSVSLCIVARDEAALIGAAIDSAAPVVDEVVVVDTGSADATVEVAHHHGARVVRAPWPGDLAAAHDLPVAHARGDWALVLDADEVLDPGDRGGVRALTETAEHDGFVLPIRNYSYAWTTKWRPADPCDPLARGACGYTPTEQVRLFRRRPDYRHTRALHQTVVPAILAAGGRIADAPVRIHHYGFLRSDRPKTDLYTALARAQAAAQPDDPRNWIDLGIVLGEGGRLPAAAAAFRRAHALGGGGGAAFQLGVVLGVLGLPDDAVRFLTEAVAGNEDDASPYYDRADAWEELGLVQERLGRRRDAAGAYRRALRVRPDSPAAIVNLAGLLTDAGRAAQAEQLLLDLLPRYRGSGRVWAALGAARLRSGDMRGGRQALDTALDIRPDNLAARFNRARLHEREGRDREASDDDAAVAERCDSVQADELGLLERVDPHRAPRPLPECVDRLGTGGVVSTIGVLSGGAGRVLVDGVVALAPRPQLVVCAEPGTATAQGLRDELAAAGVPVVTVNTEQGLLRVLSAARPSVVVHHWGGHRVFNRAVRAADERWVCVGHGAMPMPYGYDAYVVISDFHRRFQGHLPRGRIVPVPNCIDLTRFERPARRESRPVTIAMVSRLEPGKFPRRLLAHLPPLDGVRLLVAGWGSRRHEIEPEIVRRGLEDHVRFVGGLRAAAVPAFLAGADIGLHLTELVQEVCSISVIEMLAAGLPIVAEPKGCLPEMVRHGENGYLAGTETQIAAHLQRLVTNPGLRQRMGRASRRAAARYDVARYRTAMRGLVADAEDGRFTRRPPARRPRGRRPAGAAPSRSILVCATARSGSSLLCDLLTGTGLAGTPHEYFNPALLPTLTGHFGVGDIGEYLVALFDATTTPNRVFGAKLLDDHLDALLQQLPEATSPLAQLGAAFPDPAFVWLTRRDRIRQAVSWERAAQSGRWMAGADPPALAAARPRYDRRALELRLARIEDGEARWAAFFAGAGIRPVAVVYEDLAADPERAVRRVVGELGLAPPDRVCVPPATLAPQADEISERWVARFAGERTAAPAPGRCAAPRS